MEYNVVYDEDGKSHSSSILEILECQFEDFSVDDKFVDNEKTIPTDEARKKIINECEAEIFPSFSVASIHKPIDFTDIDDKVKIMRIYLKKQLKDKVIKTIWIGDASQ